MFKKNAMTVCFVLALGAATGASAALMFAPNGGGPPGMPVTDFHWAPTSYLAQGGMTAITNFVADPLCPAGSCDFNVLSHATMSSIFNGILNVTPPGLGTAFEITMTMRFGETVTSVAPGTANFAVNPSRPVFVEWWYDTTPDADALTGSGFGDGRLILRASSVTGTAGSVIAFSLPTVALDAFGTDDSPGQLTVTGTGSFGTQTFGSIVTDPAFFITSLLNLVYKDLSAVTLPYTLVDPSDCFHASGSTIAVTASQADATCDLVHVAGPFSVQPPGGPGGYVPNTGIVNGKFGPGSGPDFDPQIEFTTRVSAIPEPASLVLLGLGLAGLGFSRRKQAKAPQHSK